MAIQTRYVLIASMDVEAGYEDLFNEVYDCEHVPHLLSVPGVRGVARLKGQPFAFAIANGVKDMPAPDPVYTAIYEIDHPDVLKSPEWAKAVEAGRWAREVRPRTRKRNHAVYETQSTSP